MDGSEKKAFPWTGDEGVGAESVLHASIPEKLFSIKELDVLYEDSNATLWTYMNPAGRPSFTPNLLNDFETWQDQISAG